MSVQHSKLVRALRYAFNRRTALFSTALLIATVFCGSILLSAAPQTAYAVTTPPADTDAEVQNEDICASENGITFTEFNWFACAGINITKDMIVGIDKQIICLLKLRTNQIFNQGEAGANDCGDQQEQNVSTATSSNAYRLAWSSVRNIAYALLLLVGLWIIVSQMFDLPGSKNAQLNTLMPKFAAAAVFIPFTWPAYQFLGNFANDVTDALMSIVKGPFSGINLSDSVSGADWGTSALLVILLGAGSFAAYGAATLMGIGGVAALVGGIAVSILSGLLLLVARDVVWGIVVMGAPIAIVAIVLKDEVEILKPIATIAQTATGTILLSVPAVGLVLSMGDVMGLLAMVNNLMILAVCIEIAKYALFWKVFQTVDQLSGKIGNVVSSVSNGARGALFNKAGNDLKRGWGFARREGLNESGVNGLTNRALNRLGGAASTYQLSRETNPNGALPFTKNWKAAASLNRRAQNAAFADTTAAKLTQYDDEAKVAGTYLSADEARRGMAATRKFNEATGKYDLPKYDAATIEKAISDVEVSGGFSRSRQMSSFRAAMLSGTAIEDHTQGLAMAARIANGDANIMGQLAADIKESGKAGRVDMAASIGSTAKAIGEVSELQQKISATSDVTVRSQLEGQLSNLISQKQKELTVEAFKTNDATTTLRGKEAALVKIGAAVQATFKDNNEILLKGDSQISSDPATAAKIRTNATKETVELTEAVKAFNTSYNYASVQNTGTAIRSIEQPTVIERSAVERSTQPIVENRTNTGAVDTAGARVYAPVTQQVQKTVTDPATGQAQVITTTVREQVVNTPSRGRNDYGYDGDQTNKGSMSNYARDMARARDPWGQRDQQQRRGNPADPNYPG